MNEFPDGVDHYTFGHLDCDVAFPLDRVRCQYCPFCRSEHDYNRFRCIVTGELLMDIFHTTGDRCPLEVDYDSEE